MPVQPCRTEGKPGLKWGQNGHCYSYTPGDKASRERARTRAAAQGQAIRASMSSREKIAQGLRDRRGG